MFFSISSAARTPSLQRGSASIEYLLLLQVIGLGLLAALLALGDPLVRLLHFFTAWLLLPLP